MIRFLKRLFYKKEEINEYVNSLPDEDEWFEIGKQTPHHEVLLEACDTYDCGWTNDTAWWNEKNKSWMNTGTIRSYNTYLPYTHYRKLPNPPKTRTIY